LPPSAGKLENLVSCSLSDQIAANHNGSTGVQDRLELLLDDPGLLPNAVDEANRLSSPIQFAFREATEDNEIAGLTAGP
jgi:cytochrome P450